MPNETFTPCEACTHPEHCAQWRCTELVRLRCLAGNEELAEYRSRARSNWSRENPYSTASTADPACEKCHGGGAVRATVPCECSYAGAFERVYKRVRYSQWHMYWSKPVRVKALDFVADFEIAGKRALRSDEEALRVFHFHFREGLPKESLLRKLRMGAERFDAVRRRVMELVGKELTTMQPYPLYPFHSYSRPLLKR
jgi:hypothetical protein